MRASIHTEVEEALAAKWEAFAASRHARFAARPSYGLPWFEVLGKGELAVVMVEDGDELAAVLPLHRRDRAGVSEYRLLGHGLGTIGDVPARDDEALDALVSFLHDQGALLSLTHLPADSPLRAALRRHGGWHVDFAVDDFCPVISLPEGTTTTDIRSKSSRKRIDRIRRKAESAGEPIAFEFVSSPSELARRLPDIVQTAEIAQAGELVPRLNLCAPPHLEFTSEFLAREAEQGRLAIWGATFGGRWAAHFIGFRRGDGSVEAWVTRFDPEVSATRPGHQLLNDICDTHDERGFTLFDFLIGRSSYKAEWQTGGYEIGTLRAAPRTSAAQRRWVRSVDVAANAARSGARSIKRGARRLRESLQGSARSASTGNGAAIDE